MKTGIITSSETVVKQEPGIADEQIDISEPLLIPKTEPVDEINTEDFNPIFNAFTQDNLGHLVNTVIKAEIVENIDHLVGSQIENISADIKLDKMEDTVEENNATDESAVSTSDSPEVKTENNESLQSDSQGR